VLLAALALTLDPDAFFHQHNAAVAQVRLLGFANPHPDPKHILFCHQHNAARVQVGSPSHLPCTQHPSSLQAVEPCLIFKIYFSIQSSHDHAICRCRWRPPAAAAATRARRRAARRPTASRARSARAARRTAAPRQGARARTSRRLARSGTPGSRTCSTALAAAAALTCSSRRARAGAPRALPARPPGVPAAPWAGMRCGRLLAPTCRLQQSLVCRLTVHVWLLRASPARPLSMPAGGTPLKSPPRPCQCCRGR